MPYSDRQSNAECPDGLHLVQVPFPSGLSTVDVVLPTAAAGHRKPGETIHYLVSRLDILFHVVYLRSSPTGGYIDVDVSERISSYNRT